MLVEIYFFKCTFPNVCPFAIRVEFTYLIEAQNKLNLIILFVRASNTGLQIFKKILFLLVLLLFLIDSLVLISNL